MAEDIVAPEQEGVQREQASSEMNPAGQVVESLNVSEIKEAGQEQQASQPSEKYQQLLQQVSSNSVAHDDAHQDASHVQLLESEEEKVEKLLDLATTKGLPHAVSVAQKMKDYYVLDRMHDDLVDKLYDELVTKGLIEKG